MTANMNDMADADFNPKMTAQPLELSKKLPSKVIYCARSGYPLASVTALCSQGWPLLSSFQGELLHPIYNMPLEALLVKFKNALNDAEELAWCCYEREEKELQITMSAIMYSLGAMWMPVEGSVHRIEPTVPKWSIVVGSGWNLLQVASWYHYATSKRMDMPRYRCTKANNNLGWENFNAWLEDAKTVKKEWGRGRATLELNRVAQLRREQAMETVHAERIYHRVDFNKVWNWIDLQLADNPQYPAGRRATFKELFMLGDLHPEDWTTDDVEDLQIAIVECCDIGNDITFFINTRLNGIKAGIVNFYSSFTLLTKTVGDNNLDAMTPEEKEKTEAFFAGFDSRAAALEELPATPKRADFASLGLFLKAQAQWNILKRRFDLQTSRTPASSCNINSNKE